MKNKRQEKILEIVSTMNIVTQEDLINALKDAGFDATQATASRDIRQLKLIKAMVDGVYKYVAPQSDNEQTSKYNHALFSSIKDIKYSLNNIVIKTNPGLANAVAAGIDILDYSDILGCVAGDDTILIVTSSVESSKTISETIGKIAGK